MSRRNMLVGASTLAITVALSLGGGTALAAPPLTGYQWASGDYSNPAGTTISNEAGVSVGGAVGTLTNQGAITGTQYGVYNEGNSAGALINSGTITGSNAGDSVVGVHNNGGSIGTLLNQAGGSISGSGKGVYNYNGSIGTLTNNGSIYGGSKAGIWNQGTGTISTLTNAGAISSNETGIVSYSNIGALSNTGTISSAATGIWFGGSIGTLSNTGTITATVDSGIKNTAGTVSILTNGGSISGTKNGVANDRGTIGALINQAGGTIHGNQRGVSNTASTGTVAGKIAALTNSGTISGTDAGIYNIGSIGTLTNQTGATISSTTRGISNEVSGTFVGSITALTNNGTISGSQHALYNTGSIGTLTNSGAIIGDILNNSANGLTIGGGSGDTFGTLTGSSGSIGTIAHSASNLLFSSGNLVLNDHIVATGRTVSNTGATLRLDNTVTITGAYSQTAGGLISTSSGGSNAKLVVDGDASISNSTITLSGAGLSAGQTITIVDATTGHTGTYTGNTGKVKVTNGLGATVSTVDNDLVLVLVTDNANTYTQKGAVAGGTAAPVGRTLDNIRTGTSSAATAFQNQVLTTLDALPTSQQGDAIKQLAPQTTSPSQMSTAAASAVLGAVEQHQQTAMAYDPATGVAAGSETKDTALWGQFLGGGARRGTNAEADGYRLMDFGLATGLDHRFTPDIMGGVALSWVRAWSKGSDNSSGSSATMDSYQLTFYGTYRMDRAFVDGQVGAGWNEFDQDRAISFLGRTASASYSGQQYLAKATVGYDLPLNDDVTVTPLASLRWLRSVTEAYDESGAGAANLSVSGNAVNGVSHDLGGKVTWDIPTAQGMLKPEMRLAWVHDYTSTPISTSGTMGGQSFAVSTPRTESDGVRIGLAATLSGDDDLSFRAEYEGELRAQYQSHTALLKTLWGF